MSLRRPRDAKNNGFRGSGSGAGPLRLFGSQGSRSPLVGWYLHELGLEFELLAPGDPANPHPMGQVPALRDGELAVWESGAVLLYLQDAYAGLQGARERAPGASWVVWANATLDPCLFKETPEGRVVGTGAAEARVPRPLATLEETLAAAGPEGYLLGSSPADFSVADVAVAAYLLYIPQFFPDVHWGRLPATATYMARCAARPAYSQAFGEPLAGTLVAKLEAQVAEGPQAPGPKLFGGLFSSQK